MGSLEIAHRLAQLYDYINIRLLWRNMQQSDAIRA